MLLRKHNLSLAALIASAALGVAVGCGRLAAREDGASTVSPLDALLSPPSISAVPLGSSDVAAYPAAGAIKGALLLRLLAEPGATVRYRLAAFAADADPQTLLPFTAPVYLLPPVTVWAQAQVGTLRGPVRSFAYDYDPEVMPPLAAMSQSRMPTSGAGLVALPSTVALTDLLPVAGGTVLALPAGLAGKAADWTAQSADTTSGGSGKAPSDMPYLDLVSAQGGETDTQVAFMLSTKAPPLVGPQTAYGFDFGPSNITFATFGKGAVFLYRALVTGGTLAVTRLDTNQPVTLTAASRAVVGDVVEVELAKADVPALAGATEIVVHPFAIDATSGATVNVHLEPFFLRSLFAEARSQIQPAGDVRTWRLDLRADPALADAPVAVPYAALASAIVPELEGLNRIRFYTVGTLPLWFVAKDENGYTGLNTSDRGVLTTLGGNTAFLAKAQLLAHEFAHYQNARNSQLTPRWLQEGMSEWSAERFLYRHFPPRAVHKYLRELRFDRYFDTLNGGPDAFPLAKWGTEPAVLGYEKSLMFLDLLEARLGQGVLLRAFAAAVNQPMDSAGFQAFLEQDTGKDLTSLFAYWVNPGDPAPDADPYKLFKSADGDELLGLDEEVLGTDAELADSRGDGYLDSEAYYLGRNVKVSSLDPAGLLAGSTVPVLVGATDPDRGAALRLGGAKGALHHYSLNPFATAPELPYTVPQLLRPPYAIAAQTTTNGKTGAVTTLARALYVGGAEAAVALDPISILPLVPLPTASLRSDLSFGAGAGRGGSDLALTDAAGDLPAHLGAYDLTGVQVVAPVAPSTSLQVTVSTRSAPSPFGDYGNYVVTFDNVEWTPQGPTTNHRAALQLVEGAPLWESYDDAGNGTSAVAGPGLSWSMGSKLSIQADLALLPGLATWSSDPGDKLVCVTTELTLEGGTSALDRAGCVTLDAPGFGRKVATATDRFGVATHTIDLFVDTAAATDARMTGLLTLGQSALVQFEQVLGRPLAERNYWPFHLYLMGASAGTFGSATTGAGAYLSLPGSDEGYRLDYLFVEQLARLVMSDLLGRSGVNAPYWIQEAFIQWLTSSALYRIYPTRDVHQFHTDRISDYLCFVQGNCSGVFTSDDPLNAWTAATAASTGSVKSLIFVLQLDAALGAGAVGSAFSTFANAIPDGPTLEALCQGYATPANAALVASLWAEFVNGNAATTIQSSLVGDHGLFLFEAQRLQASGVDVTTYLN